MFGAPQILPWYSFKYQLYFKVALQYLLITSPFVTAIQSVTKIQNRHWRHYAFKVFVQVCALSCTTKLCTAYLTNHLAEFRRIYQIDVLWAMAQR